MGEDRSPLVSEAGIEKSYRLTASAVRSCVGLLSTARYRLSPESISVLHVGNHNFWGVSKCIPADAIKSSALLPFS